MGINLLVDEILNFWFWEDNLNLFNIIFFLKLEKNYFVFLLLNFFLFEIDIIVLILFGVRYFVRFCNYLLVNDVLGLFWVGLFKLVISVFVLDRYNLDYECLVN